MAEMGHSKNSLNRINVVVVVSAKFFSFVTSFRYLSCRRCGSEYDYACENMNGC